MKFFLALFLTAAPAVHTAPLPSPASTTQSAESEEQKAWLEADRKYRAGYYYSAYLASDLQGHHDEALLLLKRASDADPKSVLLLKELAEQYQLHEMGAEAASALKRVLDLEPEDVESRQKLARFYIRSGKTDDARGLFTDKEGKAKDKDSLRALAALDMAEAKWADAAEKLAHLTVLYPGALDEREMFATVLAHQDKKDEAAEQYEAVLEKDPKRPETAYHLAQLYEEMGRAGDAAEVLEQALEDSPDSPLLKDALARAYYRQEKFPQAEAALGALVAENPQDAESLLFRGMARLQQKKFKEAEGDFTLLGTLDSNNPSQLYGLGLSQLWQNRLPEAESTFEKLVSGHPKAVPGYAQLAFIYDKTSRTAQAVDLLAKGVKENPESADLYLLLGSGQIDLGDSKKAEQTFIDGVKATGNSTTLRFQLAVLYDKNGKFEEAEKELSAIIEIEPTNAQALNYLGYSWVDRGQKLSEAEGLIRRALKAEPDNHYYQDSLGWACYKLGHYEEAKQALVEAVKVPSPGPEEWIVFDHLAQVYEKLGDAKNARSNFERAKQLKPKP